MQCGILMDSRVYLLFITLWSLIHRSSQESNRQRDTKAALANLLDSYDSKLLRPYGRNRTDDPVDVTVNVMLLDLTSISDYDMEYGVLLFFRQEWYDPRLVYEDKGNIKYITLTDTSKIWTPDIFFSNEKDAHLHKLMGPNVFLRIYPSGMVLFSARVSLTLTCHMGLEMFPFDVQPCDLRIASYGYTTRDIQLKWKEENPIQITKHASVVGFKMGKLKTHECKAVTITGEFSCLCLTLTFHRQLKYYLFHTFLPSGVLLAVSWGAFFLDRRAIMVRFIIVLCALFGLASIAAEIEASVPHVDYIKAMDIWIAGCFALLLTTLAEFAFVSARREEDVAPSGGETEAVPATVVEVPLGPSKESSKVDVKEPQRTPAFQQLLQKFPKDPDHIDRLACRVLPSLFLGFTALYFYVYCF